MRTPGLEIVSLDVNFPSIDTAQGVIQGPAQYTMEITYGESVVPVGITQEAYQRLIGFATGEY